MDARLFAICILLCCFTSSSHCWNQQLPFTLPAVNIPYFNVKNTTEGSSLQKNIRQVLKLVVDNAPFHPFVYYTQGQSPDKAYAVASCINGPPSGCSTCLRFNRDIMVAEFPLTIGAKLLLNSNSTECYLNYESSPILPENYVPSTGPSTSPAPQSSAVPPASSYIPPVFPPSFPPVPSQHLPPASSYIPPVFPPSPVPSFPPSLNPIPSQQVPQASPPVFAPSSVPSFPPSLNPVPTQQPLPPVNALYYNIRNTTEGSTFQRNVRQVLELVVTNAPFHPYVYYYEGQYPDQAYAVAACINGTSSACSACLKANRDAMVKAAPLSVGAKQLLAFNSTECYLNYESYAILAESIVPSTGPPVSAPAPANAAPGPVNSSPPLSTSTSPPGPVNSSTRRNSNPTITVLVLLLFLVSTARGDLISN